MDSGMGVWLLVVMAVLAVAVPGVVLLMVWVMRKTMGGGSSRDTGSALDILKKRYALGEIAKQEFEEKKKDILS